MPAKINVQRRTAIVAQAQTGIPQQVIAKNNGVSRATVHRILEAWEKEPENDVLSHIDIYKKGIIRQCLDNSSRCFDLSDDDIYNKSTPFQRVTMGAIQIDKTLLLTGSATEIVKFEDVDEDRRARYLRLLQERMRTIDVTPTSPQIAPTSPAVDPQDTSEPTDRHIEPASKPRGTSKRLRTDITLAQLHALQPKPKPQNA